MLSLLKLAQQLNWLNKTTLIINRRLRRHLHHHHRHHHRRHRHRHHK